MVVVRRRSSLILGFRYATAVIAAVNPALGRRPDLPSGTTFVSSLLSAMILGRTLARSAGVFHRRAGRGVRHKRKGGLGPPFSVSEGPGQPLVLTVTFGTSSVTLLPELEWLKTR